MYKSYFKESYSDMGVEKVKTYPKLQTYKYVSKKIIKVKENRKFTLIVIPPELDNPYSPLFSIKGFDKLDNTEVANANIYRNDKNKLVTTIDVREDVRRLGIATEIYKYIEKYSGEKIYPEKTHTAKANSFWNQPNRKFGTPDALIGRGYVK